MLLRDLTIENFRSFEKYQLNGLARVNLLVGDNNCGKTSVLEAVHFVVSRGAFGCLFESFANRGCSKGAPNGERELSLDEEDLSALFCRDSHRSNDLTKRVMRIITSSEPDAEFRLVLELLPDLSPRELVSEVIAGRTVHRREVMLLPRPVLPDQRTVKPTAELKHRSATTLGIAPAHFFIPTRGVSVSRLSSQWDQLVDRGNAQFVEQAIQIVDPRLKRIHFSRTLRALPE